jgi:signal transduction histidine kinase
MLNAWSHIRNLPIGIKMMVGYSSVFTATLLMGSLVLYLLVHDTIQSKTENELENTTTLIRNMVDTAAQNAIRNYLRAVAETNLVILQDLFEKQQQEAFSNEQAQDMARVFMATQTIGESGYIYCANSQGVAVVHPQPGVVGKSFLDHTFVREQIRLRQGYLEYDWQNPGDPEKRPKALYMAYFEPWDWIISVSVYRDEFKDLVNVSDLRQSILALKFGKTGYSFVIDSQGNVIIHPKLESGRTDGYEEQDTQTIREIIQKKDGKLIYAWKNPGETVRREKLVIFSYIAEFDWIVASSCYLEEVFAPLKHLKQTVIATVTGTLLLVLPITLLFSASISRPLKTLMARFRAGAQGDMTVRMKTEASDEIGQLAVYFNDFMEKLALSRQLEQEILKISERGHQKMGRDLHDDIGPHLMGVDVLTSVLEQTLRGRCDKAADQAARVRGLIGDAVHKLRRLARGLCPVDLGEQGLDVSLGELAGYIEEVYGLSCRLHCDESVRITDPDVSINIYYIAHEALHNAMKHAGAQNLRMTLSSRYPDVVLIIEDDGRGLPTEVPADGMGLRIMQYRAHRIGARLSITGNAGGGTMISLNVPGIQQQEG